MAGVRDRAAPEPRPSARHNCRSALWNQAPRSLDSAISTGRRAMIRPVTERRRIGLRESFREASRAEHAGDGDAGLWAAMVTAVWFWIRVSRSDPATRRTSTELPLGVRE
jgi:hypothetical protein